MRVALFVLCLCNVAWAQINTDEYVASSEYDLFKQRKDWFPKQHVPTSSPLCCQWTTPLVIDTTGSPAQYSPAIAVDDSGNIAVTWSETPYGGGASRIVVVRSTNKGQTWIRSVPYGYAYARGVRDIAFDHAGNLWLLWTSSSGEFQPYFLNLSRSTDNGQTFTTLFTSREYAGGFFESKLAIDRSNNIFILWDDQQFKLTRFTAGNPSLRLDANIPNDTLRVESWCSLAVGNEGDVYSAWIGIRRVQPGDLRYYLFCSTSRDTGRTIANKIRVDTTEAAQGFPSCTVDATGIVHIGYGRIVQPTHLSVFAARSLDGGNSFLPPTSIYELGSNTNTVSCADELNGIDLLWSGDGGAYFSRSTNGGQTFSTPQLIVAGRPDIGADPFGNLFGVFETALRIQFARTSVLVSVTEKQTLPSDLELEQNYPNPFNPSTIFTFTLPSSAEVKLAIYDMLGREIEQIIHGRLEAGRHTVLWYPKQISSGVYLYRLEMTEPTRIMSATKKLIYIR